MLVTILGMNHRIFGATGASVSEIGLGCWQLGGSDWEDMTDERAMQTLNAAVDSGVNFFDTADIYGRGRSETLIGQFTKQRPGQYFIATKLGKFPTPGGPANMSLASFRQHTEASLKRLGVE